MSEQEKPKILEEKIIPKRLNAKLNIREWKKTTTIDWCARYVNIEMSKLIIKKHPDLNKRDCEESGHIGDARTMHKNLIDAWWDDLFNIFPRNIDWKLIDDINDPDYDDWILTLVKKVYNKITDTLNPTDDANSKESKYQELDTNSGEVIRKVKLLRGTIKEYIQKNMKDVSKPNLKVWDVVWLYYPLSDSQLKAYRQGTWGTFNTHVWYVSWIKNGTPIITHNIHGKIYDQKLNDLRKIPKKWNKDCSIGRIVRPKLLLEN